MSIHRRIGRDQRGNQNPSIQKMTDETMAKRERIKGTNDHLYNTLHRKLGPVRAT